VKKRPKGKKAVAKKQLAKKVAKKAVRRVGKAKRAHRSR
jgi:DNA transformation protein